MINEALNGQSPRNTKGSRGGRGAFWRRLSVGNSFSRAPHPLAIRLGIEASLQEMMKSPTADWDINRLNYWIDGCGQFTLVTDGFLYGDTLIEETVEDLLRWEDWLARSHGVDELDVAGIS